MDCSASLPKVTTRTPLRRGAEAVWLGLDAAADAARAKAKIQTAGREVALSNARKWTERFLSYKSERARNQARANFKGVRGAFNGTAEAGRLESKALLGEAWMVYPPDNGQVTTMVSQPTCGTRRSSTWRR